MARKTLRVLSYASTETVLSDASGASVVAKA